MGRLNAIHTQLLALQEVMVWLCSRAERPMAYTLLSNKERAAVHVFLGRQEDPI